METTFPWYNNQVLQMMYSSYPYFPSQINFYPNSLLNFGRIINQQNELPIFTLCNQSSEVPQEVHHQFTPITLKGPLEPRNYQNRQELCESRQKQRKNSKQTADQNEYVPVKKASHNFSARISNASLNENRNILPNAIHQILSYVQRKNKSQKIVQKLIKKFSFLEFKGKENLSFRDSDEEISVGKFYAYQNHLKAKMPNYVKMDTFKQLCTSQSVDWKSEVFSVREQMIYNKICRCVVVHYLKEEVVCVIMSSKRMQREKKREHLKVNRRIEAYIRWGFREEED